MTKRETIAHLAGFDFRDTKSTFAHKSTPELRKSALLFRLMSKPGLVNFANKSAMTMADTGIPVAWAVKPTLYKQFVGGETLKECEPVVKDLKSRNINAILDYSAEAGSKKSDYESVVNETLRSIEFAKHNDAIPFTVFKPTAIGDTQVLKKISFNEKITAQEQAEADKFKARMFRIADAAYKANTRLLIDAEDFWFQEAIDNVVFELMLNYNRDRAIIFNTWQMYRHDRLEHLKKTITEANEKGVFTGVKLVRGAYMEKERERAEAGGYPSPIHPDKVSTDNAYNDALELCINNLNTIEVFNGTHNEFSTSYLAGLMIERNIPANHPGIWFAQLFGMSDHITTQLAIKGYNVTKYVPYGPVNKVLPYLSRRAQENTSVKGQTGRELSLIAAELKRRKSEK